ncbi:MAG: hypothetical protein ACK4TI_05155, partial [Nitrososphaerales archaeon]
EETAQRRADVATAASNQNLQRSHLLMRRIEPVPRFAYSRVVGSTVDRFWDYSLIIPRSPLFIRIPVVIELLNLLNFSL